MAEQPPLDLREKLRDHALGLPETYEDHPWGETVVKVRKKIFLFLGVDHGDQQAGFGVKLVASHDHALSVPGAAPTGYGLGKAGWVNVPLETQLPPTEVLLDWVEESYRLVAPKRVAAVLDRQRGQ